MNHLQNMMASHPQPVSETSRMSEVAHHIAMCALVCTSCADACLAEPMVGKLVRCIRLNLDCADICATTSGVLVRQVETDSAVVGELLRACATACQACAEECAKHAGMHEHCRICAEHCRACVEVCEGLIQAIPA